MSENGKPIEDLLQAVASINAIAWQIHRNLASGEDVDTMFVCESVSEPRCPMILVSTKDAGPMPSPVPGTVLVSAQEWIDQRYAAIIDDGCPGADGNEAVLALQVENGRLRDLLTGLVQWGNCVSRRAGVRMGDVNTGALSDAEDFLAGADLMPGCHHQEDLREQLIQEMREAMQEFVDRVDRGEIRSKRTYQKFKKLLDRPKG